MSIFFLALRACAGALLACATALAEPASELVPPALEGSGEVPYPPAAEGDAAVVLELVVERTAPYRARRCSKGSPFAELASGAAHGRRR